MGWGALAALLAAALAVCLLVALVTNRRLGQKVTTISRELDALQREYDRVSDESLHARTVQAVILEAMREGVLLLGPDGSTAFSNAALVQHLGGRPQGLHTLAPLALREAVELTIRDARPRSPTFETGVPSKWLSATVVPAGGDGAVLVVVTDVTDSKRLEAVRRDFVANASHELKTPAASIRAAAETILDAAEDDLPAIPRFARQLEREAARLSQIVEDLLDLSRLESGSDLAEDVRVDSLVRDVALRVADRVREARVSLVVHADKRCVVKGSAQDLSLLVGNLLDNAIRHTQAGGSITVSVDCDQASVSLTVSDTGIGIPSKDLPRVFERFYRVDRARSRETGGTGLGLSIVKHVAENHGGSVEVQSELAAGTTFTVLLPLAGE